MKSLVMAVSLAFGASGGAFAQPAAPQAEVQPVLTKDLGDLPGKEGLLLRVTYPPGSADQVHRHDAHGFVYVEEGSVVMQVRGGQPVTLQAGQGFYEGPNDVHVVGRNASKTKPARLVVFLVKDIADVTVGAPGSGAGLLARYTGPDQKNFYVGLVYNANGVYQAYLALNKAGIPAVDLIDFDYPHWHRLSDVPANCSAVTFEPCRATA